MGNPIKQFGNKLYVSTDYHGLFVSMAGQNKWKELNKEAFIKIDGNRQIKMITLDSKVVSVKIEDLDKKSEYNGLAK